MQGKGLTRQFRTAAFRGPQETDAFVLEAGDVAPADLPKLLAILLERPIADEAAHRNRCAAFAGLVEKGAGPELGAELFAPAVHALRTADPILLGLLVRLMPKFNHVAGHLDLCQVLDADTAEVRRAAAEVLRLVGGKTAFETIEELARRPGFAGRLEAMEGMVPKALHHTVPLLASVLSVGTAEEKTQALRHLGDLRYMAKDRPAALSAVATALLDESAQVVAQAIASAGVLAEEDDFFALVGEATKAPAPVVATAVVEAAGRYGSSRSIAFLSRKFAEGPTAVRHAVLDALELIGREEVLPLLVEAISHRHLGLRNRAADLAAKLSLEGRVDYARTIFSLLRSRDVDVRRIAVDIVHKVGDPDGELAPKLLRFVRDEDWWVRERIMDALVEMAGDALTLHLVDYLQDPSDVVRRFAIGALRRIKDPNSLGALLRVVMDDEDWWAREQAIEAISLLGDERAVPYLCDYLEHAPELRVACVDALRVLHATEAAWQVAELLADPDPDVRVASIAYLSEQDDRSQGLWLKACENDDVLRVRKAARELLARWEASGAGPHVALGARPEAAPRDPTSSLDALLEAVADAEADDVLLAAGRPPYLKRHGKATPMSDQPMSAEEVESLLRPHLSEAQQRELEQRRDIDFSHDVKGGELRFRANVFHQHTGLAAVFRSIKSALLDAAELGLPPVVSTLGDLESGLVLIGGPTGSGKSTTLASLIDHINRTSRRHVLTLEDPIEVVHAGKKGLVNQREVGTHTRSFDAALRATLREDPDVILVGELRDLDTIRFAMTAAETGHLVLGTVRTVSADTTIDRLINAFPPDEQPQVRALLAETLRAVVCQHLLARKDQQGRLAVLEVMRNDEAIATLIRNAKTSQIPGVLVSSRELGMQSMDAELVRLVREGKVASDDAFAKASDKKAFEAALAAAEPSPILPAARERPDTAPSPLGPSRTASGAFHAVDRPRGAPDALRPPGLGSGTSGG